MSFIQSDVLYITNPKEVLMD